MSKNIFHPVEVLNLKDLQVLDPPYFASVDDRHIVSEKFGDDGHLRSEISPSSGPSIEQLKKEADDFRQSWETERNQLISDANKEVSTILDEARSRAEEIIETAQQESTSIAGKTEESRVAFDEELKQLKEQSLGATKEEIEKIFSQSRNEGIEEGKKIGFEEGNKEVGRLAQRLHVIIDHVLDKRKDILTALEGQVIELAILIVRRVVKVLSENQKNIVINNIVQALERLKSRSDIVIRVNLADLETVTEHTEMFVRQIEGDGKVTLAEDSSVDPGGCIIETDFGEIDARISSQLSEIESRIRDLMPVTLRPSTLGSSDTKL
ncbi:hypothetical protein KUCAC02_007012 [Chaenocephalus aceratus]|nr:hypothetical protein KUCAC02_007012 [Chaenocephalus aceratus]